MALIDINSGTQHKISNCFMNQASHAVEVNGSMRAEDVVIKRMFNGKDESIGDMLKALINTLIVNGVIDKEDFIDHLNATKVLNVLADK